MSSINNGTDLTMALSDLLSKVRISHGEAGVNHVMRSLSAAASDAQRRQSMSHEEQMSRAYAALHELLNTESILNSNHKDHILQAAFEDGSSLICSRCKGLIKKERWQSHAEMWCPALNNGDDSNDGDDADADDLFQDSVMEEG